MNQKIFFWVYEFKNFILFFTIFFIFFKVVFGLYFPIIVVQSSSMEPHLHSGDIVFIHKQNVNLTSLYNVIVYHPYGNYYLTPVIHRTLYYVQKGEIMWIYGPLAEHSGFITKGDNTYSNYKLDQQSIICSVPIKKEWVIGIESFSIPRIGKLIFYI